MDKTIKYIYKVLVPKEPNKPKQHILQQLENEYGKNFEGKGFAVEVFKKLQPNK